LRDRRVLVVDDEEDARELTAVVLEAEGAVVTHVGSASGALDALRDGDFDVLVSDIGMPNRDGYDLIRTVRTNEGSANARRLPAVAVTAFSAPEDRKRALTAGFDEHLSKPVDVARLVEVIARLAASRPTATT
jgi:CheY-like chemotaxis protein